MKRRHQFLTALAPFVLAGPALAQNCETLGKYVDFVDFGETMPIPEIWDGLGAGETVCSFVQYGAGGEEVEIHCHWWNSDEKTYTPADAASVMSELDAACPNDLSISDSDKTDTSAQYREAYGGDYVVLSLLTDRRGMHLEFWYDWEEAEFDFLFFE